MDRIPTELFVKCVETLFSQDLLTCLRVCKSWKKLIEEHSELYQIISVGGEKQFQACYKFFQKKENKEIGKRVHTLEIVEYVIPKTELFNLATLFPNVIDYRHEEGAQFTPHSSLPKATVSKSKRNQFAAWCHNIECIEELGSPVVGPAVLAAAEQEFKIKGEQCLKLTKLHISFDCIENEKQKRPFIENLHNAPNLEKLRMEWMCPRLEDMEKIHTALPKLAYLEISNCNFQPTNNDDSRAAYEAPATTGKAEALHTLVISAGSFEDAENISSFCGDAASWLKYFGKKYNLTNFVMGGLIEQQMNEKAVLTEDAAIVAFMSEQTKLKYFNAAPFKVSVKLLNAMDKAGIQLKVIDVCNWDASKYVDHLLKSKQMESIETLIISGQPYSNMEFLYDRKGLGAQYFLKKLAEFPNLRHLRFNESKDEVTGHGHNLFPLDLVLTQVTQLESITMDFATIMIEDKNDKVVTDINLRKLDLIECYIIVKEFEKKEEPDKFSYYPSRAVAKKSEDYLRKVLPNVKIVNRDMDSVPLEELYEKYLVQTN